MAEVLFLAYKYTSWQRERENQHTVGGRKRDRWIMDDR